jgi:hypothetical protein
MTDTQILGGVVLIAALWALLVYEGWRELRRWFR